jgi:hypothetical protein
MFDQRDSNQSPDVDETSRDTVPYIYDKAPYIWSWTKRQ